MGSKGTVFDAEGLEGYCGESRRQQGCSVEWWFSGSGCRRGGVGLVAGSVSIGGCFTWSGLIFVVCGFSSGRRPD